MKCSCNMIWLQSWLQQDEQRHPGPRCSDGILLREHKISKHNCDDILESVPGCEGKFLLELLHRKKPPHVPIISWNFLQGEKSVSI